MNSLSKILAINAIAITLTACGGGAGTGGIDENNKRTSDNTSIGTSDNLTPIENSAEISKNYNTVKAGLNTCINCHKAGGVADGTGLVLFENNENGTIDKLKAYMAKTGGRSLLLSKSIGLPFHAGGAVFGNENTTEYKNFEALLISIEQPRNNPSNPDSPANPDTPNKPTTPAPTLTLNRSVIQPKCLSCHSATGPARGTDLVFQKGNSSDDISFNEAQITNYVANSTSKRQQLLDKSRGLAQHGGGPILALGSAEYNLLANFVGITITPPPTNDNPTTPGKPATSNDFTTESASETYRRASLYLTGEIPSRSKVLSLQGVSNTTLRSEIVNLMQGDGFKEFLKNGANARLNSRHLQTSSNGVQTYNRFYTRNVNQRENRNVVRRDLAEEPLEIIANVVMNNRPYSEILTADYTMVSQYTDESYNTGLELSAGEWRVAKNNGQDAKTPETFNRNATGESRITNFPHAGVLSTWSFLSKYGTTATNRNRARARWTLYHFLGFDIEKSAERAINITDVADEDNPTLNNPACTVCHQTLDPIAGAFKYFHERVGYKAFGTDSLDQRYRRRNPGVDWYQDMLPAGFNNQQATGDPLQWLAQRIVADSRFATGAVKFWWFAVFGEDVLGDDAPRNQFDAQQTVINTLANDFRQHLNLKILLANMMLTDTFRAANKVEANKADNDIAIHMGGRRLLSHTELKNKTASLTGITWGGTRPRLDGEFRMLYGAADDITVERRATELTSMMFRVAERQAYELSCAAVVYDFSLEKNNRSLFSEVERTSLDENAIRNQIVVLYERLHNRFISSTSTEASQAYQLFLDLRQARINAGAATRVDSYTRCDNRIGGSRDDVNFVMTPWRGLLAALMSDPDYIYE